MMKIFPNKILLLFLILSFPTVIFGNTVSINEYKLEIEENNGRFMLSMKNQLSEYISVFSETDLRTSRFSIFDNNGSYTLGDTFRYQKHFNEKADGGIFIWTSKELLIEQEFTLNAKGFLQIDVSISNISITPKTIGMKFLLDTAFEDEDYFYIKTGSESTSIVSEFEVEDPADLQFWTSGARNSQGAALMGIFSESIPSRIIFGNWDLLDEADYHYNTKPGRDFNSPPFSINDCAILYLYSPKAILPQNSLKYSIIIRPIHTVEELNQITDRTSSTETMTEEEFVTENGSDSLSEKEPIDINRETVSGIKEIPIEVISLVDEKLELIIETLKTIDEIQKLIVTLSKPGIINNYNLSQLEEMINKLDEIIINEN